MKAYCINLDSRSDRWQECLVEFERIGLQSVGRISARIDKGPLDDCAMDHAGCVGLSILSHDEMCLIMEDDVQFTIDDWGQVEEAIAELSAKDPNWDMLYLGLNADPDELKRSAPPQLLTPSLYRVCSGFGTHAYIIRAKIYQQVIHLILKFHGTGLSHDVAYSRELLPSIRAYCVNPLMALPRSDTTQPLCYSSMVSRWEAAISTSRPVYQKVKIATIDNDPSPRKKPKLDLPPFLAAVLSKNKGLQDIHAGQRCFIVGNGPSLNKQNIDLLRDEVAIVVNSFHLHKEKANVIKPRYLVLADPLYFQDPDRLFIPLVNTVNELNTYLKLFLPVGGLQYFASANTGPLIDKYFFGYDYTENRDHNSSPIDFSDGIPPYGQNVVMVCLMLAFYMGCNPIYLIGCDHDLYTLTQSEYERGFTIEHAYSKESTQIPLMTWSEWCVAKQNMFLQYEQLRAYSTAWGFDVFNATHGGYLETFQRASFESLFPPLAIDDMTIDLHSNPRQLAEAAIQVMNAGDALSALFLLNAGIKANLHNREKIKGIDYLKSVCLAKLNRIGEALTFARQDYLCNPTNRSKSILLIEQLEQVARTKTEFDGKSKIST